MSSENQIERKPLTIELSDTAQDALFRTLYSVLYDQTRLEVISTGEASGYWKKQNEELRTIFVTIATNLLKTDQFNLRDKIGMGLTKLLTEEELSEIIKNPDDRYYEHALYLLKNYKQVLKSHKK